MKITSPKDVLFVLVSYLPIPKMLGEMKTKPTQYAVRTLNSAGIQPDIIVARAEKPLDEPRKKKISIFCNIAKEDIISAPDIKSIYEVPLNFEKDNIGNRILKKFGMRARKSTLKEWKELVKRIKNPKGKIKIGIVGKYFISGKFTLMDSYISVIEAVKHACWENNVSPEIHWISSEKYERDSHKLQELKRYDGIIVPGGFGKRGTEGKIMAIQFCRENKICYLGLCLGLQLAVVEWARNMCNLREAHSTEFNKDTKYPVIDVMPEQKALLREKRYGATMRLGAYPCHLKESSLSLKLYGQKNISERHRHRYEFNNRFKETFVKSGLTIAGVNEERGLVEIIEAKGHPFFLATQFHPEFKSRPLQPHPLFKGFIKACLKRQKQAAR
mgnify:CR=1 FL=1